MQGRALPPPVPISEAVPNPEENNPIYRALAFPIDAPRGGPSRPLHGPHERYLPVDREGHCRKAHATAMAEQGPPQDLLDKEMDRPPQRARREADAANMKDLEPKVVRLPTEAELDEGYIFD